MATATQLQPGLTAQFRQIIQADHLSQAYIFVGQRGTGKGAMAQWIAQRLFCTNLQDGSPCGQCAECQRIASGNNPDVLTVRPEGQSIKTDAVRALKDEMSKSSMEGHSRVFIIEDADKMTTGAANSLLKFFEEPYPGMVIILTTTAKNRLLPTVLSRAQIIQFPAPSVPQVAAHLEEAGVDKNISTLLASLTKDIAAGEALAADEDFGKQLQACLGLLALLAADDRMAFPYVQTDLMKTVSDRPGQERVLAILAAAFSEALARSYGREPLVLPNASEITGLSSLGPARLAAGLAAALEAAELLRSNVGFQADVERFCLRVLNRQ
ncbi:DNA polymerase III subunit delta' [Lacticaseibacillus songhuajiangensis]|jgi:DNA polymerase-3 subunit delta'|uniref:DNA polymerase III subunit delta' n=1 Tax=Lacticaseibacillus songhuajiangensis TaxID=1296539 RepID=UPI000F77301F|nr:DNA polymerase III subunit delta' [Lacticaseibacillus songhuajiangensis]